MNTGTDGTMLVIRALRRSDDCSDLIELTKEFYNEYETHDKFYEIERLKDKAMRKFFIDAAKKKNEKGFVAIGKDGMAGYILVEIETRMPRFYKIKKVGLISLLMVGKNYRRDGIASKLLKSASSWLKSKGVEYVYLETTPNNEAAIKFYEKYGFKPVHVQFLSKI